VVHGAGGYDELSPFGPAEVVWIRDGWTRRETLDPQTLGIPRHKLSEVAVASKDEAVAVLIELLEGHGPEAMKDMLALNLGACLHLLEQGLTLKQGVEKAREAVAAGVAAKFWNGQINA
jgi:anthranilate phosphoribosyltransferase